MNNVTPKRLIETLAVSERKKERFICEPAPVAFTLGLHL